MNLRRFKEAYEASVEQGFRAPSTAITTSQTFNVETELCNC